MPANSASRTIKKHWRDAERVASALGITKKRASMSIRELGDIGLLDGVLAGSEPDIAEAKDLLGLSARADAATRNQVDGAKIMAAAIAKFDTIDDARAAFETAAEFAKILRR